MRIPFTKMHGLGNDYVYVNCFETPIPPQQFAPLARAMSDRHRGIGSDGLILICPPQEGVSADVRMQMFNADGSRGQMCGNGIRCVAKYVIDRGVVPREACESPGLKIQTDRGVLDLTALMTGGLVDRVRVNMGPPILQPEKIPVNLNQPRCLRHPLTIDEWSYAITCVSMGNPHAVCFVDSLDSIDLRKLGPAVERNKLFPERVNFHIAQCHSQREVSMRTWERGSGITMACGTGACAVVVAGVLEERLDRSALVHLPGGDLTIQWEAGPEGSVFMTGPAVEVFSGEWEAVDA